MVIASLTFGWVLGLGGGLLLLTLVLAALEAAVTKREPEVAFFLPAVALVVAFGFVVFQVVPESEQNFDETETALADVWQSVQQVTPTETPLLIESGNGIWAAYTVNSDGTRLMTASGPLPENMQVTGVRNSASDFCLNATRTVDNQAFVAQLSPYGLRSNQGGRATAEDITCRLTLDTP